MKWRAGVVIGILGLSLILGMGKVEQEVRYEEVLSGFTRENIMIPCERKTEKFEIENGEVVENGYWEFKGDDGNVLDVPVIQKQPEDMRDRLVLALKKVGESEVRIYGGEKVRVYLIRVTRREEKDSAFLRGEGEQVIEEAAEEEVGEKRKVF